MYRQSLRWRFTVAAMLLVTTITGLLAVIIHLGHEQVEDHLLESLMQREVDEYTRMYRIDHDQPPPRSSLLHSYIVEPGKMDGLPPELSAVTPGIHHDILIDGRNYQVANFTLEDKRFYLMYDITQVEARAAWMIWLLVLSVAGAGAAAGVIGWRLSSTVISPVTRLAGQIGGMDPQKAQPDFERRFPGFEVGALARAFDTYLKRIGQFISRERAFTEDASHELRTPVAVIGTAAERLISDPALPAPLLPAVQRMQRASRQMQASIQALLYMAREHEPEAAALEQAPLREVAEQALEAHRHMVAGKPLNLSAELDHADERLIPRGLGLIVMGNLLQNAINHCASGEIRISLTPEGFSVADTGPGLAEAELARIFERHYRGPNSSGQGLGLDIVKRVCERMNWSIAASSIPGRGTTFSVRL